MLKLFKDIEKEREKDIFIKLEDTFEDPGGLVIATLSVYDEKGALLGDLAHVKRNGDIKLVWWSLTARERVKPLQFTDNGYVCFTTY